MGKGEYIEMLYGENMKKLWELLPSIIYESFYNEDLIIIYNSIRNLESEVKDNNIKIDSLKIINENLLYVLNDKQEELKLLIDKSVKKIKKANRKRVDD